jgi:hypothetical protein
MTWFEQKTVRVAARYRERGQNSRNREGSEELRDRDIHKGRSELLGARIVREAEKRNDQRQGNGWIEGSILGESPGDEMERQ